jgi:heme exporter protein D
MSLGPHAAFIWLSYLVTALAVGALLVWLFWDGRRHERRLADLEARGVRRRSSAASTASDSG